MYSHAIEFFAIDGPQEDPPNLSPSEIKWKESVTAAILRSIHSRMKNVVRKLSSMEIDLVPRQLDTRQTGVDLTVPPNMAAPRVGSGNIRISTSRNNVRRPQAKKRRKMYPATQLTGKRQSIQNTTGVTEQESRLVQTVFQGGAVWTWLPCTWQLKGIKPGPKLGIIN